MKRSSKSRSGILEQTTYLTNGIIHTSYNINKDTIIVVCKIYCKLHLVKNHIDFTFRRKKKYFSSLSRYYFFRTGPIKQQGQQLLKHFAELHKKTMPQKDLKNPVVLKGPNLLLAVSKV